ERYEESINPEDRHLSCSDSVHGLICFETPTNLEIWNPTIRRFFTLPKPESSLSYLRGFLGYDPVECKYKVLIFLPETEIRVLTLGAQESWRKIKASPMHCCTPTSGNKARCVNGVLYYIAKSGLTMKEAIMSFDLRLEKFNLIEFPMDDHSNVLMVTYEGRLGLVSSMPDDVKIWVLEDAENKKWSYKRFVFPQSSHQEWIWFDFKGVTDAGELIYTPSSFYDSFHVVYFDPKKQSVRETKFEGVACDEFRRLKGLGFRPFHDLNVFPDHIESLFSL
ncbi:hypothetical protein EUTSA_v10015870mg, partial [Eutrema salsugineum]